MNETDFYDFMSIDPLSWGKDVDPIGLLTYQNYKRRREIYDEYQIDEVLTLQQRMRRKILMRRLAPRLARARKISMRRRAGTDVLKRRAKVMARKAIAKKLLGGKNKADLAPGERARIEKILAKRKKAIDRLAVRFLPIARKKQAMRFAAKTTPKKTSPPAAGNKPNATTLAK